MKANVEEEFHKWLLEITPGLNKNVAQLSDMLGIKREDLFWAFCSGWNKRFQTLTMDDIY